MVVNRIQLLEQCWEMELGHPWLSVTGHLILESHDPFFRAGGYVVVYTQNKSTERVREREPARINPRNLGDNHGGRISSLLLCSSCQKKIPVSTVSLRRASDTRALIPGGSNDLWEPIRSCLFYPFNRISPFFLRMLKSTWRTPAWIYIHLGLKRPCLFPHSAQPHEPRLWHLASLEFSLQACSFFLSTETFL